MENILKAVLITISLFISSAFADNLVLSTKLRIEYPTPLLISHGSTDLIVKYKDWTFMHEVFNTKNFYPQIDLTGVERDFVRAMFDSKSRSKWPGWFAALSKDQAEAFGITPNSTNRFKIGNAEIFTVHDKKSNKGQIFIFDELVVHQIAILGTKEQLDTIAHNIKER